MPRALAGPVEHIEILYQRYLATGRTSDALAWMNAAAEEEKLRRSKRPPERTSPAQEATHQRRVELEPHQCRRCGIDTTLPIWCIDCIDL